MINPGVMTTNIKYLLPQFKDRYKNFSTAKGNLIYGYNYSKDPMKTQCLTTPDGQFLNLNDAPQPVRSGATVLMSNDAQIGWRTTTDNNFKVAKYGLVRTNKKLHQSNPYIVANSVNVDQKTPVTWENLMISPALSLKIVDLAKQKYNKHLTGLFTMFGVSDVNYNVTHAIPDNALITSGAWNANNSQDLTPNTIIGGRIMTRNGKRLVPVNDTQKIQKTVMSPEIINYMVTVMSNRKLAPRQMKDLREFIEESSTNNTMYVMDHENMDRKTNLTKNDPLANRRCLDVQGKCETMKSFNYSNVQPKYANASREMQGAESYKLSSQEQKIRKNNGNDIKIQKKEYFNNDQDYGTENALKRNRVSMGSKYVFNNIKHEDLENENMSDISGLL